MSITLTYGRRIIDDCESNFTAGLDVACSVETTTIKRGRGAAKFTVDAAASVQIIGYRNFSATKNLSGSGASATVKGWFRSNVALSASDYSIILSNSTEASSVDFEILLPAASANVYTEFSVSCDLSTATTIASIGVKQKVDKGAMILYLDQVEVTLDAMTFANELNVIGFDNPENEEGFPNSDAVQLLDGNWSEKKVLVANRNISFSIVVQTNAELLFLRNWYFAGSTRQITYDSETIDVVRTSNVFPVERYNGLRHSQIVRMEVKEKTARAIGSTPSSWTN